MKTDLAARLLASFISELTEQVRVMNAELLALEASPDAERERIHALFRIAHTLKGAARAAGVSPIERSCHQLEELLAKTRDGSRALAPPDFQYLFATADTLADAAERLRSNRELGDWRPADMPLSADQTPSPRAEVVAETRSPAVPRSRPAPSEAEGQRPAEGEELLRVQAAKLDKLLASGTDLQVAGGRMALRAAELEALNGALAHWAARWRLDERRVRGLLEKAGHGDGLLLDELSGELEQLAEEAGSLAIRARADARSLSRWVDEVLEQARSIRMRPFAEACEGLPRAVRDLAAASGKEVKLELEGREVEADRVVLDGLRDGLLQLVRNAVDHGIETPERRVAAGKPRSGTVRVGAELRGDRLEVAVSDDGAGLDAEAIRAEMNRRGRAAPLDERELGEALFETRLSTRAQATTLSGRGVGLDIVRASCARVGGHASVTWQAGKGARFLIDCPVTMASLRALTVSVASHVIAIPVAAVEKAKRVSACDLTVSEGRTVLPTPDGEVPVAHLSSLLAPLGGSPTSSETLSLVLLRDGPRRLAMVVDELLEVRELAVRPLRGIAAELPAVRGAALLETGSVALVVEPAGLVTAGLAQAARPEGAAAEPRPQPRRRRRVLVVDDSSTTRTMECSILEDAGYDVSAAVDGRDGWRLLQEQGSDLVVADVEMPGMDGLSLCETIRASERFARLPVVLVTGREKPEDRARGLAAGADAYLGKSSFDPRTLVETVQQLLLVHEVVT